MTSHHLGRRLWKAGFQRRRSKLSSYVEPTHIPQGSQKETSLKKGLPLSYEMGVWIIMWPQMTEQVPQ